MIAVREKASALEKIGGISRRWFGSGVAKLLVPSKNSSEFVVTVTLSVVAAIIAIYAGQWAGAYHAGEPASFFGAVAGSMIVLWISKYPKVQQNISLSCLRTLLL